MAIPGSVEVGSAHWSLDLDDKKFTKSMQSASQQMKSVGDSMVSMGKTLSTRVTLPIVALGGLAIKTASDYESAMATIVSGTGASGDALDDLESVFQRINKNVPQAMGDVSLAVAETNTRLGVTGDELETATFLMLEFARTNQMDVAPTVQVMGRLFNALDLEADGLEGTMDKLQLASQKTGIGVLDLANNIIDAGPAFEELGFGLDESIALFSQFEAAGARPQEVISSINILLNRMAEDGVTNGREAMESLLDEIKEAPNIFAATEIASGAFGARVGSKVAEDIRNGRFEVEDFVDELLNSEGVFMDAAEGTRTFSEEMMILWKNVRELLRPFGQDLIDIARRFTSQVGRIVEKLQELSPEMRRKILLVLGLAAAIGPLLIGLGLMIKTVGVVIGLFSIKFVAAALLVVVAIAGIVAVGKRLVDRIGGLDDVTKRLQNFWHNTLAPTLRFVWDYLKDLFHVIKTLLIPQFELMWKEIQPHIPLIKAFAKVIGVMAVGAIIGLITGISFLVVAVVTGVRIMIERFSALVSLVQSIVNGIVGFFHWLYRTLVGNSIIPDIVNGIIDWFKKLPQMITGALGGLADSIANPFRKARDMVGDISEGIRDRMSNLNPMKRFSPSLVDQVKKGVSVMKGEFKSLGDVQIPSARMMVTPETGDAAINATPIHQSININVDQVGDMQDVRAIGRELGFRVGITPGA